MREGLYKAEFHTVHGTGTGVVYATGGKLRGGNSAFAFIGSYAARGDGTHVKISTQRYNADPAFKPLVGALRDKDAMVRQQAEKALQKLGAPGAEHLGLLRDLLKEAFVATLFAKSQPHAARNHMFDHAPMHGGILS